MFTLNMDIYLKISSESYKVEMLINLFHTVSCFRDSDTRFFRIYLIFFVVVAAFHPSTRLTCITT